MFKRALMIAVAALFPVILAAQEPPPIAIVANVLSLSDDQVHALIDFLQARGEAVRPSMELLQAKQAALATQLQSPAPDPQSVGQLLIDIRNIQQQIQQAVANANAKLDDILDADQRTRLDQLRGAAQACGVIPAFKAVGLL